MFRMRPWQQGDDRLLAAIGDRLSATSLQTRFLAGVPTIPAQYLRHVATAPRAGWDAVVALRGDDVIGWAEFARWSDVGDEAELAVVVVDAWQRRGIGAALARTVVERCRAAGVRTLTAEVLADNLASNRLILSLAGGVAAVRRDGAMLHYRIPLDAARVQRDAGRNRRRAG